MSNGNLYLFPQDLLDEKNEEIQQLKKRLKDLEGEMEVRQEVLSVMG